MVPTNKDAIVGKASVKHGGRKLSAMVPTNKDQSWGRSRETWLADTADQKRVAAFFPFSTQALRLYYTLHRLIVTYSHVCCVVCYEIRMSKENKKQRSLFLKL